MYKLSSCVLLILLLTQCAKLNMEALQEVADFFGGTAYSAVGVEFDTGSDEEGNGKYIEITIDQSPILEDIQDEKTYGVLASNAAWLYHQHLAKEDYPDNYNIVFSNSKNTYSVSIPLEEVSNAEKQISLFDKVNQSLFNRNFDAVIKKIDPGLRDKITEEDFQEYFDKREQDYGVASQYLLYGFETVVYDSLNTPAICYYSFIQRDRGNDRIKFCTELDKDNILEMNMN